MDGPRGESSRVATPETTVRCYVRTSVAAEPVDEAVKTLRTCEEEGRVDRLLVDVWPDSVRLPDPASHDRVVDAYRLFREWAEDQGVDLDPAFIRRECRSQFTGAAWEELITPVICLAVYREGELVGVYPHTDDGEVVTVGDALAGIETGALPAPAADGSHQTGSSGLGTCPVCGGDLVDGQGLYLCTGCAWLGVATGPRGYRRVQGPRGEPLLAE